MNFLRISALSAAACLAAAITPAVSHAVVPAVDKIGQPAVIRCGTTPAGVEIFASHADKIIFSLGGFLQAVVPAEQAALDTVPRDTKLDIKVLDNPRTVADLKGKVLSFLGAVDSAVARQQVQIVDVVYAMVCPTGL